MRNHLIAYHLYVIILLRHNVSNTLRHIDPRTVGNAYAKYDIIGEDRIGYHVSITLVRSMSGTFYDSHDASQRISFSLASSSFPPQFRRRF